MAGDSPKTPAALLAKLDWVDAPVLATPVATPLPPLPPASDESDKKEIIELTAAVGALEAQLAEEEAQLVQLAQEEQLVTTTLELATAERTGLVAQLQQLKRSEARQQGVPLPADCESP